MTALPRPDRNSAKELFADALERSTDERAEFLAQACRDRPALQGEVELLLAAHERSERRFSEPVAPFEEQPGDRIGRFKLLQRIGEGGFGAVWMAEQEEPVRRKVALKVLKAGMDTAQVVARFEAERQALALMDHQNIARVFDGGATPQGRPYFAMELVRGVPITQYCDEAALSPRERLELFLPICQAVQHAHYKGVIHRDIKPSNVLVTLHDGVPVPKVIDFGIAKATQGRLTERTLFTEFRQMLGTPEYMAPEQAEMSGLDVDTRADVYSLGVLLYELLTGTRPFEFETLLAAGYAEMLRTIREVEPPKPSTRVSTLGDRMLDVAKHRRVHPRALGPLIRGDLDWIVMKSLEKDRSRRYTTASALADDLRRHLRSEPVEAGPPSKLYELRKYVVRHRLGVTAGAAIALSLVAGLAAAGWGWRRASDEAERANGEAGRARTAAARAEQVVALLEKLLGSADPHALKGPDYRVRQLLDDFDREFTDQLESEPEVEASLRATLAESFLGLGLAEPARAHAARAQALRLELFGAESPEHADSLLLESSALHVDGLYEDALAVCAQAVELLRALGPERSEPLAGALLQQGDLAWHLSRGEEAEAAFQEVIRSGGEGDESLVTTAMERLGVLYATQGRLTDAEMAFRQVLERRKGMERGESMELAGTCAALAGVLVPRGELDEALEYAQEAVRIARSAAGDTHPSVAHHMATLAGVWTTRGELERGAETLAEAAGIQRAVSGGASPALADILRSLARAETMLGRTDSGLRHATEALAMRQALGDEGSASMASDQLVLSGALAQSMRLQEAEEHARAALEIRLQIFGDDHHDTAQARYELGCILDQRGQRDAAATELSEALRILGQLGDADEILTADTEHALAVVLFGAGRAGEAEPHVGAALEARIRIHGERSARALDSKLLLAQVRAASGTADGELVVLQELMEDESPVGARRLMMLARTLRNRGELAAADESIRAALRLQERLLPADHVDIATSLNELGQLLRAQGRLDEAVTELERAAEIYRSQGGAVDAWLASTWVTLGSVHLDRNDARAAEGCTRDALEILRSGADPLHLASAAALLGQCLLELERAVEAEPLLRESLAIRRARIPDDWQRYSTESLLGAALLAQGEAEEAEPLLVQAAEKLRPPPSQMERRRQALARVIALYEATSRPEQAATWRRALGELESAR